MRGWELTLLLKLASHNPYNLFSSIPVLICKRAAFVPPYSSHPSHFGRSVMWVQIEWHYSVVPTCYFGSAVDKNRFLAMLERQAGVSLAS